MSVRYRITHKENIAGTTVTYRADILDSEYGGSVQEKLVSQNFFDWEYDLIAERKPFENPVQKSSFTCDLLVQSSAEQTLLNDILDADEDRFTLNFYIGDTHKWSGKILTDQLKYPEGSRPFTAQIKASDLSRLEGVDFEFVTLQNTTRLSEILAECFNQTGLTLPIRTYTNLTNSGLADESADFIYSIFHQKRALRGQNSPMTCFDVLQTICRAYNLIIRQADARWIIEQLPAVAKGDDVQFDYDSDGLNPASSTPSRTVNVDGSTAYMLPGSENKVTGALKSVESHYKHRTFVVNLPTGDVVQTEADGSMISVDFGGRESYRLKINLDVSVSHQSEDATYGEAFIRVSTPPLGFTYLNEDHEFESVDNPINVPITLSGEAGEDATGTLDVARPLIPDGATSVRIEFFFAELRTESFGVSVPVDQARFTTKRAFVFNELDPDWNAQLNYRMTRTGNYSVTEQIPETVLGDGPTDASRGTPHFATGFQDTLPLNKFRIRGESENLQLEELTLRERVSMRRGNLRNLRAELWMNYSPEKLISYDSKTWFFLGGHFVANRSRWSANILALDYSQEAGDIFQMVVEEGGDPSGGSSGSGTSSGSGLTLSQADSRYTQIANALSEINASDGRDNLSVYSKAESNAAFLAQSNNLSDLDSATTARTNLGVAIGSDVQAWDSELDTLSGLTAANASSIIGISSAQWGYLGGLDQPLATDQDVEFAKGLFTGDLTVGSESTGADLHVYGNIFQEGALYETHLEQLYTTKDFIISREGAEGGLASGAISGHKVLLADGTNDVVYGVDSDAIARVGWEGGTLQAIATREDSPTANGLAFWNDTDDRLDTNSGLTFDGSVLDAPAMDIGGSTFVDSSRNVSAGTGSFSGNVTSNSFFRSTVRNQVSGEMDTIAFRFSEGRGWGYNDQDDRVFYNGAGGVIPFWVDLNKAQFSVGLGGTTADLSSTLDVGGIATFDDDILFDGGFIYNKINLNRGINELPVDDGQNYIFTTNGGGGGFFGRFGSLGFASRNADTVSSQIGFFTGGSLSAFIDSSGNFGIGVAHTNTLSRTLDVNGTLGTSGKATLNSLEVTTTSLMKGVATFESDIQSKDAVSRVSGWQGDVDGNWDFRSIFSDSLVVKAFTADVAQAFRGSRFLTKSFATIKADFTIPTVSSSATLTVAEVDGFAGLDVFEQNDYILLNIVNQSGSGLVVGEAWGEITSAITDNGDGTQSFTFTTRNVSVAEIAGQSANEGSEALSFGSASSPKGFIHDTVLDNLGSPYSQVITWTTNPWNRANWTVRTRTGNLAGIANASGFGFYGENQFLTGYSLIGDLTKAVNYIEYDSGTLTGVFDQIEFDSDTFVLTAGGMVIDSTNGIELTGGDKWLNDGDLQFGGSNGMQYGITDYELPDGSTIDVTGKIVHGSDSVFFGDVDVRSIPRVSDEGLVALYHLDDSENFFESVSGGGGSYNGGTITQVDGVSGKAIYFDGRYAQDDYKSEIATSSTYSLSVWVYWNGSGSFRYHTIWTNSNSGSNRNGLNIDDNTGRLGFQSYDGSYSGIVYGNFPEGEWVHIVCVQESGSKKLYINSEEVGSSGNNYQVQDNAFKISYQDGSTNATRSFNGNIDECRVYSRVLSESEIKSLYANPSGNSGGKISANQVVANQGFFDEIFAQDVDITGKFTLESGAHFRSEVLDFNDTYFALDATDLIIDSRAGGGIEVAGVHELLNDGTFSFAGDILSGTVDSIEIKAGAIGSDDDPALEIIGSDTDQLMTVRAPLGSGSRRALEIGNLGSDNYGMKGYTESGGAEFNVFELSSDRAFIGGFTIASQQLFTDDLTIRGGSSPYIELEDSLLIDTTDTKGLVTEYSDGFEFCELGSGENSSSGNLFLEGSDANVTFHYTQDEFTRLESFDVFVNLPTGSTDVFVIAGVFGVKDGVTTEIAEIRVISNQTITHGTTPQTYAFEKPLVFYGEEDYDEIQMTVNMREVGTGSTVDFSLFSIAATTILPITRVNKRGFSASRLSVRDRIEIESSSTENSRVVLETIEEESNSGVVTITTYLSTYIRGVRVGREQIATATE